MWVLESDSGSSAYMRGKENLCSYALRMSIRKYHNGEETHIERLREQMVRCVVPRTVVGPSESRGASVCCWSWCVGSEPACCWAVCSDGSCSALFLMALTGD